MHDKTNHIFHWKDVKLEDMPIVAKEIIEKAADIRIFTLSGDLGAGKTTLVKEFCALLQVLDVVGSPTFSIVNEYRTRHAEAVYHFDLYRIKRLAELEEIGFDEYLFSGNYCLIEWPEIATDLFPENRVELNLKLSSSGRDIEMILRQ